MHHIIFNFLLILLLSISPSSLPHNASTCIQRFSQTSSSFMSNNGFVLIPGVTRIELHSSLYFALNSIIFFLSASLSNGLDCQICVARRISFSSSVSFPLRFKYSKIPSSVLSIFSIYATFSFLIIKNFVIPHLSKIIIFHRHLAKSHKNLPLSTTAPKISPASSLPLPDKRHVLFQDFFPATDRSCLLRHPLSSPQCDPRGAFYFIGHIFL